MTSYYAMHWLAPHVLCRCLAELILQLILFLFFCHNAKRQVTLRHFHLKFDPLYDFSSNILIETHVQCDEQPI